MCANTMLPWRSVGARELLADPTIYRAKNDAGICYPVEGFFGGPNRKECVPVSQYKFYYTCCEESAPQHRARGQDSQSACCLVDSTPRAPVVWWCPLQLLRGPWLAFPGSCEH